ncbi:MAG: TetR/AcrR family transcriptional regulator [Desulfovibrionaceae bacterium]|nr:TetR/AcrR family transcriptional regulator [Desulfovibrionaceae bacterium]MBF0514456.1 TetR/AcrR family transcriptional regulator [Desulfovibrionaceae bacterium]
MSKRDDILDAATHLFAVKGYQDTSIADISRATGAADGTIFYHFKNKEEILVIILRRIKERILAEFRDNAAKGRFATGLERAENVIRFYLALTAAMETEFMLLFRNYPYQLANINEEARSDLEAVYTCFLDFLTEAIVLGKADGSIDDLPEDKVALVIFGMLSSMVRFRIFNLFPAAAVYPELLLSCRKILSK